MRFYRYRQNNSGGDFIGPENIVVEAPGQKEADAIAEENGVYWNGVDEGSDCPCCGDRWGGGFDGDYDTLYEALQWCKHGKTLVILE